MPLRDRIVIGASAGGVDALKVLVSGLPRHLSAAVFIVLHIPAWHRSEMPQILNANGALPASHPQDGERIENGRIYVAPPGRHLLLFKDHIHLGDGPKENRHRPSVNVLFRSAAQAYGARVVGVVLTGAMDDGTGGLWEVKRHGGIAVVQDPADALFPDMPQSAMQNVEVNYTVPLRNMAPLLSMLASQPVDEADQKMSEAVQNSKTHLTCPDCRGPISEFREGRFLELRCRVGHSYSPEDYLAAHVDTRERALWKAVVSLEEGAEAARTLAKELSHPLRSRVESEAGDNDRAASTIREVLTSLNRRNAERVFSND